MATLHFRSAPVLPLAALAGLLTGCALFQRFSFVEPTVDLAGLRVTALSLSGGELDLALAVHNPNPYPLGGSEFSADVALEDHPFGSIARTAPWTIPAQGDTAVTLHLTFGWSAVGSAARGILERGSVRYRLAGRVRVTTPIDDRWVSVERRGDVPLERLVP